MRLNRDRSITILRCHCYNLRLVGLLCIGHTTTTVTPQDGSRRGKHMLKECGNYATASGSQQRARSNTFRGESTPHLTSWKHHWPRRSHPRNECHNPLGMLKCETELKAIERL